MIEPIISLCLCDTDLNSLPSLLTLSKPHSLRIHAVAPHELGCNSPAHSANKAALSLHGVHSPLVPHLSHTPIQNGFVLLCVCCCILDTRCLSRSTVNPRRAFALVGLTSRRPLPVSPRPPSGIDTSRCWARQCRRTGETPVFCTSVCVCVTRETRLSLL